MPDPVLLTRTLRQCIRAFQETPGRRGRVVALEHATEVLVGGDLHGNLENFRLLLNRANLAQHPFRHLVLQELVHGPHRYPMGGDKSHQLVDLLAALKCQYPLQVHMLLGNHELAQWTGQWIAKADSDLNEVFRAGVKTAYGFHADDIYGAYLELFAVLPVAIRTPHRVFVSHSLPNARRLQAFDYAVLEREELELQELMPGGSIYAIVWGRDTSPATASAFLQKVDADLLITGHIPCERGFDIPNSRQLIVDSMATPACYCLFPADRPLTHQELVASVGTL